MADYKNLPIEELLKDTQDSASWYWLGMAYWERNDFTNAAIWFEKTMNDSGNEWTGKAALLLGMAHASKYLPNSSRDEALRLFERNPDGIMSVLNAGFLYHEGTETKHNPAKGKELIETAICMLIKADGNDHYLTQIECFRIGGMYHQEKNRDKAIEYFQKAKERSDPNYKSDRKLIEMANKSIQELNNL